MISLEKIPTLSIITLLMFSIIPAFGEVTSFHVDKTFYEKGDEIIFSGTVENKDGGLVSIVIRDSNDEFVLLTQAFIEPDNTFERSLQTDEKFEDHGIHNATAFILDLANGKTVVFDFSQDGTLPTPSITSLSTNSQDESQATENLPNESQKIEAAGLESPKKPTLASFVDPTKDPQHYLDRYYNEPAYKEWFDSNYPDITIEEAVGLESPSIVNTIEENLENVMSEEVIPKAEAVGTVQSVAGDKSKSNDVALLGLALGGLGILFGAIYGIKRKVDTNSENISKNRESIKKKMFGALQWNKPEDVIKNRLAHGEITVKEYSVLKKTLSK